MPPRTRASATNPASKRRANLLPLLLIFGLLCFGVAGLSIADMFVPRPYDGVVLYKIASDDLRVREVVPGSGADLAGIEAGNRIMGIGRTALRDEAHAAKLLSRYRIGDHVPYLIKADGRALEVDVKLGRRQIGDGIYFYICALGFAFFFVGLFVLVRQPGLLASQVFFLLSCLFQVFLVCRLRPASYSGVDSWILGLGTLALVLLPPAFLHFYVLFPRPAWIESLSEEGRGRPLVWLFRKGWPLLYFTTPVLFALGWWFSGAKRGERWFSDAPQLSWWLLGISLFLGLMALGANGRRLLGARERRGVALVLAGSVFGLLPFAVSSLFVGGQPNSRAFLMFGLIPLALVPITFTYAIVRFQLLDIRIILRRSLLYTVSTALLTGLYAGTIAAFNSMFSSSKLVSSGYFPIILALAIVLLFDPVRKRVQQLIDRSFFAGRSHLEQAMEDLGEAMMGRSDLQGAVGELVDRLPRILGFRFAGLYMLRRARLERIAGPEELPIRLPVLPELQRYLAKRRGVRRLDQMGSLPLRSPEVAQLVEDLAREGVEAVADLASRRRHIGLVLLSDRPGRAPLEDEELVLLERLLSQAAMALETGLLLEERTQKAELEREMEIAATIQAQLLPQAVRIGDQWTVSARCLPARLVGGDFFAQLPVGAGGDAVIYGDVSGKSVSGAMMMMAAHEALYTLAMAMEELPPERLFALANKRLYGLGKRSFVALGYFAGNGDSLDYLVAGQPPPLLRRLDGTVEELPLPEHRVPLGALPKGEYAPLSIGLKPGELLLAYSDGVTDARSPEGEFFGEERLEDVVASTVTLDPDDLVSQVLAAVKAFTRGGLLYDDVTLLAIGRSSESGQAAPDPEPSEPVDVKREE